MSDKTIEEALELYIEALVEAMCDAKIRKTPESFRKVAQMGRTIAMACDGYVEMVECYVDGWKEGDC